VRKTFKILTLLLTLGVVWYLFQDIVINAVSARPCKNPISYSLVAFDERFGISRDYFINALKEAVNSVLTAQEDIKIASETALKAAKAKIVSPR